MFKDCFFAGSALRKVALVFVACVASLAQAATSEVDYQIGAGDILRVDVYAEADLSGDFLVHADGHIFYPLLGKVAVAGKSMMAASALLTSQLQASYLHNPQVSVSVKEYLSRKVEVLGSVEKPGVFYLDRSTRLFDILARAGGISARLGAIRRGQTLRIRRATDATARNQEITVDLYQLLVEGNDEANVTLLPGDVIYVPENQFVHVIGEVKEPGMYPFEAGITVLKAITLAGGTDKKATLKEALVRRVRDGAEQKLKVDLEYVLEPDDIVEVRKSFW